MTLVINSENAEFHKTLNPVVALQGQSGKICQRMQWSLFCQRADLTLTTLTLLESFDKFKSNLIQNKINNRRTFIDISLSLAPNPSSRLLLVGNDLTPCSRYIHPSLDCPHVAWCLPGLVKIPT